MAKDVTTAEKSPARSAAMARAWEKRKSNAAAEAAWFEKPVCLCGCGEALIRHRNVERQRYFKQGHDARLKSVLIGVLAGDAPKSTIPAMARVLKRRIGFLGTKPELLKAF